MFRNFNITFKTAHSKLLCFTGLIMIYYLAIQLSAPSPRSISIHMSGSQVSP